MKEFTDELIQICKKYGLALRYDGKEFKLIQIDEDLEHYIYIIKTLSINPDEQITFHPILYIEDTIPSV
jgi:PleD family two-component response regulator